MSKYVPPHLRGAQDGSSDAAQPAATGGAAAPSAETLKPRNLDALVASQNDRPDSRGGYRNNDNGYRRNDRNYGSRDGGGYGGRSYYGGGGGGRYGSGGGPRRNELGFHGDLKTDVATEKRVFGEVKSSGINFDKYDDIPVETSGNEIPEGIVGTFEESGIHDRLKRNLSLCGYSKPTPVQKYSIPFGLADRDIMACAQTGSGKTGGFLFPTISMMLKNGPSLPEENPNRPTRRRTSYPNCLILAPTRELASQILDEADKFTHATGIRPCVIYGGADIREQMRDLERGCDMLVATPGRLVDLMDRGRVSVSQIRHLILDEADRMLDMGFEPQIRRIVEQEGMPRDRQTFMFSATFPQEIQRLAADFLKDYLFLTVGRVGSAAKDITQIIEYVEERDKDPFLVRFLNTIESGLVLVFVETKRSADSLEYQLSMKGFPTTSIHGNRTQREREDALRSFRTGETPIMVATDVAARGLDISNVLVVINYDMPGNIDDYVHRIGRTGRAGNTGRAVSMVNEKNRNVAADLLTLLTENNQKVPDWLHSMGAYRGRSGQSRGRNQGRNFGARDYRGSGGGGKSYNQGGGSSRRDYGNSGGYQQSRGNYGGSSTARPNDAW